MKAVADAYVIINTMSNTAYTKWQINIAEIRAAAAAGWLVDPPGAQAIDWFTAQYTSSPAADREKYASGISSETHRRLTRFATAYCRLIPSHMAPSPDPPPPPWQKLMTMTLWEYRWYTLKVYMRKHMAYEHNKKENWHNTVVAWAYGIWAQ